MRWAPHAILVASAAPLVAAVAIAIAIGAAGCSRPPVPFPDAGPTSFDIAMPPAPDCTHASAFPDCYTCCSDTRESGALNFDQDVHACVYPDTGSTACASPCANTVNGMHIGLDSACYQCLQTLNVDGGACQSSINGCLQNDGPCADFWNCVQACPHS